MNMLIDLINSAIHSYQCFDTNIFGYSFVSKFDMTPWYGFLNQEMNDEKIWEIHVQSGRIWYVWERESLIQDKGFS